MRPAKTQISLCIRPVWSESSFSAWRNFAPLTFRQNPPSEDFDQTARMCRLIWFVAGRSCPKVRFLMVGQRLSYRKQHYEAQVAHRNSKNRRRILNALGKHAYSNIYRKFYPYKTENFQIKKLGYFSHFSSKHRLWEPVRTALARRF